MIVAKKDRINKVYCKWGDKEEIIKLKFEAPVGFEPTNKGFADLPLKPLGYSAKKTKSTLSGFRAGNGTRTRDINLGKVALYQLSYSRMKKILKTLS